MNQYVTGAAIKKLREKQQLTQTELAELLGVSDRTVSKWETGRGFPDITFIESLARFLKVSVVELFSGEEVENLNRGANLLKGKFYVCPVCGNAIFSTGKACINCCGITLPSLESEEKDEEHKIEVKKSDGEIYVSMTHEMAKSHYISWFACVRCNSVEFVKNWPEQAAEARFRDVGECKIYAFCIKHGLFEASFC